LKPQKDHITRLPFGKGTLAMLIGIASFAAYSYATKNSDVPQAAFYEADRNGRLVKVERPRSTHSTAPPLVKPEPGHIIRLGGKLSLTEAQLKALSRVDADWQKSKASLEHRMGASSDALKSSGKAPNVQVMRSQLEGYSELSRTYAHLRELAWLDSLALLSASQREAAIRLVMNKEEDRR
jgi:hypothetical protein